jgi:hypothetical protein
MCIFRAQLGSPLEDAGAGAGAGGSGFVLISCGVIRLLGLGCALVVWKGPRTLSHGVHTACTNSFILS